MKNAIPVNRGEIRNMANNGIARLRHRADVITSFIHHAGLSVKHLWCMNNSWPQLIQALLVGLLVSFGSFIVFGSEYQLYIFTGLLMMGLSYLNPFRDVDTPLEIVWDIVGFFNVIVFEIINRDIFSKAGTTALLEIMWIREYHDWSRSVSLWIVAPCHLILADFGVYWTHRWLHSRALWSTHAWHHSAKNLNWLSGSRASLVHTIVLYAPYTPVFVLFPTPDAGFIAWCFLLFYTLNQHYLHSNIWLPFQTQIEWVLVTPRYHFVHHSAYIKRTNSNFGLVFTVWDRLFGTFTDPATVERNDPLGLDYEIKEWRLLVGLPRPKRQKCSRSGRKSA
jgi:sterol desaturase/sphingolipid hydroxylase (fatty acid hydroxylase superfamily)